MNSLIIVEIVDLNTFVVFQNFFTVSYFIFSYNILFLAQNLARECVKKNYKGC
jgi:hypothetical protein